MARFNVIMFVTDTMHESRAFINDFKVSHNLLYFHNTVMNICNVAGQLLIGQYVLFIGKGLHK